MPALQWVGQSLRDDDNAQSNTSRLLNVYRERHGDKFILKSVLGTASLVNFDAVFMRAMRDIGGPLHAVTGGKVYRVTDVDGATVFNTSSGVWEVGGPVLTEELAEVADAADTTIEGNNGAVTVSAAGTYYNIASDGTVTTPTTGAFSSVGSVSFLGQRTIITEKDGRRFGWSDPADSTTFDALNFATAESEDDNIIRGMAIGPQYWIFGERSIERWYLSGSANTAEFLLPISGGAVDIGLKAFGLIAQMPNGAFFVGDDGIVYLVSGGSMQPISTRGVETAVKNSTPQHCLYYEDEGHKICVIHFADRPAWAFDVSSNEWHERAEGREFGPWSATASARAEGFWFVGTSTGEVRRLERSNREANGPLWRRAVSTTLENDGQRFTIDRVQVQPVSGMANVPERIGANIITNGTFDTDFSGWTEPNGGWLVNDLGQALLFLISQDETKRLYQGIPRNGLKKYQFYVDEREGSGFAVDFIDTTGANVTITVDNDGAGLKTKTHSGIIPDGYDRISFYSAGTGAQQYRLDDVVVQPLIAARAPEFMIRLSKDRGQTWGKERWRDTGEAGDYDRLVTLRALGQFRRATMELTMTDPVDVPMTATAFVEISA